MDPTLPINERVAQMLYRAILAGKLAIVNEQGKPVGLYPGLNQRCWAHLTDAADGRVYVHELKGTRELQEPRYLELLGINV